MPVFPIKRSTTEPPRVGTSVPARLDTDTGAGEAARGLMRAGAGLAQWGLEGMAKLKEASDAVELSTLTRQHDEIMVADKLARAESPDEETDAQIAAETRAKIEALGGSASTGTVAKGFQMYHNKAMPRYAADSGLIALKRKARNLQAEAAVNTEEMLAKGDVDGAIAQQQALHDAGLLAPRLLEQFKEHASFRSAIMQARSVQDSDPEAAHRRVMLVSAKPGYQMKAKTQSLNEIEQIIGTHAREKKIKKDADMEKVFGYGAEGNIPTDQWLKENTDLTAVERRSAIRLFEGDVKEKYEEVKRQREEEAYDEVLGIIARGERLPAEVVNRMKDLPLAKREQLIRSDLKDQEKIMSEADMELAEVQMGEITLRTSRGEKMTLEQIKVIGSKLRSAEQDALFWKNTLVTESVKTAQRAREARFAKATGELWQESRERAKADLVARIDIGDDIPTTEEVNALMLKGVIPASDGMAINSRAAAARKPATTPQSLAYRATVKHIGTMWTDEAFGKQSVKKSRSRYNNVLLVVQRVYEDESLTQEQREKKINQALKDNGIGAIGAWVEGLRESFGG